MIAIASYTMATPADDPGEKSLAPYLSIVIVGRNDDYGQDFMSRLNTFVRSLDRQLAKHPGLAELIIVEWNPLADRPGLSAALVPAPNTDLRVITVPKDVHDTIGHPWPVLEFYGKNVGIRRAQGEYIMTTNPDIIFSDEMINVLAQRPLNPGYFYRTDRFDFRGDGMDALAADDYVDFAISNVFQGHLSDNLTHEIAPGTPLDQYPSSDPINLHTNGAGDFIMAHRDMFHRAGGVFESTERFYHLDAVTTLRLALTGARQSVLIAPLCIFHQDHPRRNPDPWDPQLALDLAKQPGSPDWGLKDHQLEEWSNQ